MPDSSYYDAVTETLRYRPKLAVTLMAAWETERPDSPRLARVLTAFWRNASQLTKDLQPEDYVRLVSLMGDGVGAGGASAYDVAVHASDLFERYYHHAAPFHRDALLAIWRRCPGADGRCAAGLEKVEARIGHLRPESEPRASRDPAAP
jgi:class 3 adenylate cyclase